MNIMPYVRKINFYETDAMGVVHHANYIKYFEEARVDWLEQVGHPYEQIAAQGIHFAIVGVACDYLRAVKFGDTAKIVIGLKELSSAKMVIDFCLTVGDTVCAKGEGSFCAVSVASGSPKIVSLKRELPQFFALLDSIRK